MKKNILAAIAGLGVTIAITFLFHRIVMGEQFKIVFEKIGRPQNPVAAILGYLILVTVTVYLFAKVYDGGSPALAGTGLEPCSASSSLRQWPGCSICSK